MKRLFIAFIKTVLVVVVAFGLLVMFDLTFVEGLGRPVRWEIADGYKGWAVVEYENPTCAPLGTDGLYLVIPILVDGKGCTSSKSPTGWRFYRYEYVGSNGNHVEIPASGWGGGGGIWAPASSSAQSGHPYPRDFFFVGSEAELNKNWRSEPR